jgi:hypothetical protein
LIQPSAHRPLWRRVGAILILLVLLPILFRAVSVWVSGPPPHWSIARWDSAGIAPDPRTTPEPVIEVYAARAWGWRGVFAVHSWIVAKRRNATGWHRYEVLGWGVSPEVSAVRDSGRPPDGYWAGARPILLAERRGPEVEGLIDRLQAAVTAYPETYAHRVWPGPNSNSFTAFVLRALPELGCALPSTAIGKDYLVGGDLLGARLIAPTASGTGIEFSVFGLAGIALGLDEGVEVNLLGLVIGIDVLRPHRIDPRQHPVT